MAFIAWTRGTSRAESISQALGGEAFAVFDLGIQSKPLVPVRYLISAVRTFAFLMRRRPRAVIVQAPPVPAVLVVWTWAKLARVPVVLDTHPASFGMEQARIDRLMRPLLEKVIPHAAGCIVTTPRLGEQITRWSGRPLVVHEAPMPWSAQSVVRARSTDPQVLFICTFAPDEPVLEVLEAARRLPHVRFRITGEIRRVDEELRRRAPANVEWVGYLRGEEYVRALADADAILSLTTRRDSVARSAYEAIDALRPLVLTNFPHMVEMFPYAIAVENTAASIAAGVSDALSRLDQLAAVAPEARALQQRRWDEQLGALRDAIAA